MRVGVVGLNHKLADLKLREILAKVCQKRFSASHSTHGLHYFVLLSTCNRTELYFSSDDLTDTHTYLLNLLRKEIETDFDQKCYSFFGHDCFNHLAKVTAGLDSAIIAETEIQGQVKNAYEAACQFFDLPEDLHYLFQKSLKIGKKIRSSHFFQKNLPEIEHAIYQTGEHFFKSKSQINVLFVGVSEINQKIIHYFSNKENCELTICNRSENKILPLQDKYALKALPWQNLHTWPFYDWVIFGTKAPYHLATQNDLIHTTSKLLIDLSVPRNVDPRLARHPAITLLNIDQINRLLGMRKQKLHGLLEKAEKIVHYETEKQTHLFYNKQLMKNQFALVGA